MPNNLTATAVAGLRWTYLAVGVSATLQLAFAAIMGRLLGPVAFGLVALAQLALSFAVYFARMGIGQALVQKPDLSPADVRAGFVVNAGLGLLFSGLVAALAPLAAMLFDDPAVVSVLRLLGLNLFFTGLASTGESLLRRDLAFRMLAMIELVSYVVGYFVVGLVLAATGAGVYSLVGAALAQSALYAVLAYGCTRHPLQPTVAWNSYRSLFGFGSRISVISFFEFLSTNLDTLAVGRFAGTAAAGYYNRAYMLVTLPTRQLNQGLAKVLFPSFSRIQKETDRLRGAYLSAIGVAAAFQLPVCAGIAIAAPEIVQVVLGPQWTAAVPLVPFLALAACAHVLSHFSGILLEARAVLNAKLVLVVGNVALLALLLFAATRGTLLTGYAAALAGAEVVKQLTYAVLVGRTLGTSAGGVLRRYVPALITSAIIAALIASVRMIALGAMVPAPLVLGIEVLCGAVALGLAFRWGPLRSVRRDVARRAAAAGLSDRGGRLSARLLAATLGPTASGVREVRP